MMRQSGMTLVEVLVSVSLVAFMSFVLYSTISTTRAAQEVSELRADQYQASAAALDLLLRDINMAYLSLGEDMNAMNRRTLFRGRSSRSEMELTFSSFSHKPSRRNVHESDSCLVQYYLENDRKTRGLYNLIRRETRRLESEDPETIPAETRRILGNVVQFEAWFYDSENEEWLDNWDTTTEDGQRNRLPGLVRLHLVVEVGTGFEVHFHSMARPHIQDALVLLPATGSVKTFGPTQPAGQPGQPGGTTPPAPVNPNIPRVR